MINSVGFSNVSVNNNKTYSKRPAFGSVVRVAAVAVGKTDYGSTFSYALRGTPLENVIKSLIANLNTKGGKRVPHRDFLGVDTFLHKIGDYNGALRSTHSNTSNQRWLLTGKDANGAVNANVERGEVRTPDSIKAAYRDVVNNIIASKQLLRDKKSGEELAVFLLTVPHKKGHKIIGIQLRPAYQCVTDKVSLNYVMNRTEPIDSYIFPEYASLSALFKKQQQPVPQVSSDWHTKINFRRYEQPKLPAQNSVPTVMSFFRGVKFPEKLVQSSFNF